MAWSTNDANRAALGPPQRGSACLHPAWAFREETEALLPFTEAAGSPLFKAFDSCPLLVHGLCSGPLFSWGPLKGGGARFGGPRTAPRVSADFAPLCAVLPPVLTELLGQLCPVLPQSCAASGRSVTQTPAPLASVRPSSAPPDTPSLGCRAGAHVQSLRF